MATGPEMLLSAVLKFAGITPQMANAEFSKFREMAIEAFERHKKIELQLSEMQISIANLANARSVVPSNETAQECVTHDQEKTE